MKTTISAEGNLIIQAETPLECFALKQWWDGWQNCKFKMAVMVNEEKLPVEAIKVEE